MLSSSFIILTVMTVFIPWARFLRGGEGIEYYGKHRRSS